MGEGSEKVFTLRYTDGSQLGHPSTVSKKNYETNPRGWRQEVEKTKFSPLTIIAQEKPQLGENISTDIGKMRVARSLSPEDEEKWPDSIFVEKAIDQPKV